MRIVIALILGLLAAGPALAETVEVVLPPPVTPAPLPAGAVVRPVSLTRFAANIAPGTLWRQDKQSPDYFFPCTEVMSTRRWTEGDNKVEGFETFNRIFRDELQAAGFREGGDPTNLFEQQTSSDLQVGALVTGLRMKTCNFGNMLSTTYSGSAAMDIEWQIFSVSQGKILARVETHGGFEFKRTDKGTVFIENQDASPILRGAFADNVRRLAADEEFRKIVLASAAAPPPPAPSALSFAPAGAAVPIDRAIASVVTVYAGDGFGSGVLISSDGYILTNHHVAGSSGQVRVHWSDGVDTVGEVLRGDPRRDVALIKTEARAAPLSIRHTGAQLGETVFAVGTPLDKKLSGTVTRGIVSATRLLDGLPMIQSDVAVDHGNSGGPLLDQQGQVVALTVLRYGADDTNHSLNFFIPIDDALRALALSPAAAAPPPPAKAKVTSKR